MSMPGIGRAIEILLVEDNGGGECLAQEALDDATVANNLNWVKGGVTAIESSWLSIVKPPPNGRVY